MLLDDDSDRDGCHHCLQPLATVPSAVFLACTGGVHWWPTHGYTTVEKDPEAVHQDQDGSEEDQAMVAAHQIRTLETMV